MKRTVSLGLAAMLVLSAVAASAATPASMSVQVKNGQLRSTASFLGGVVGSLGYGDRVSVVEQQGDWMKVTSPAGKTGWVHSSALTKKVIQMKAGSQNAQTSASGDELALAGKGFNSDVEADFKAKNKSVDFTWVDRMEKYKVSPEEMQAFLKEGGVKPSEGGAR
jgi:uncharacterized protein YgiM (DUF1202 family)